MNDFDMSNNEALQICQNVIFLNVTCTNQRNNQTKDITYRIESVIFKWKL